RRTTASPWQARSPGRRIAARMASAIGRAFGDRVSERFMLNPTPRCAEALALLTRNFVTLRATAIARQASHVARAARPPRTAGAARRTGGRAGRPARGKSAEKGRETPSVDDGEPVEELQDLEDEEHRDHEVPVLRRKV